MELLPIGPVVIIDTPGIDDEGTLGEERVRRALRVLEKTDIAVLVTDSTRGLQPAEQELIELFRKREIPFVIAHNKADLTSVPAAMPENEIYVSAAADSNIRELMRTDRTSRQADWSRKNVWLLTCLRRMTQSYWSCRSTQPHRKAG